MQIEVLVTTMHCTDFEALYRKMGIRSNAVIANQGTANEYEIIKLDGKEVKCVSRSSRGVSLNRNTAIKASTGNILVVGDDDVIFSDDYEDAIKQAYREFPNADIILFDVLSTNPERPSFELNKTKICNFREMVKFGGFQITFRRNVIEDGITFNEMFGPGSKCFPNSCGEDTLFLTDAHYRKHTIAYVKRQIGTVNHAESTWIAKRWSDDFFRGMGALFYEVNRRIYVPFVVYYALAKLSAYKNKTNFFNVLRNMFAGVAEYKRILKKQ